MTRTIDRLSHVIITAKRHLRRGRTDSALSVLDAASGLADELARETSGQEQTVEELRAEVEVLSQRLARATEHRP